MAVYFVLFAVIIASVTINSNTAAASNDGKLIINEYIIPATNPASNANTPTARVVGGSPVLPRDQGLYRHQVRLSMQMTNDNTVCGGSIISPNYVLTAAHCVDDPELVSVDMYFGMLDESQLHEHVHRNSPANLVTINPNWSRARGRNDIALIRLTEPLEFSESIHSIRLGNPNEKCTDSFGRRVIVSGWGIQKDYYTGDTDLNTVEVSVVKSAADCRSWAPGFVDFNSMFCLDATGNKGACSGDSGGPMVFTQSNGLQLLLGLTSFGSSAGCENSSNRIFTCIQPFRPWLVQVTGDNTFAN